MQLAPDEPYPVANLARLMALTKRGDEATEGYRAALQRVEQGGSAEYANLKLQSQLWLGNRDAAQGALEELAQAAIEGDRLGFSRLVEQAGECRQIGIGLQLAELMEGCLQAEFLKPFSLALRAAGAGGPAVFAEAPPEIALMAEEVLAGIRKYEVAAG